MSARIVLVRVTAVPERLRSGRLYVSDAHAVAVHVCPCGCGAEVVTPLGDGGWVVACSIDGARVSLAPSIRARSGCRSHYWVRDGRMVWADRGVSSTGGRRGGVRALASRLAAGIMALFP